MTHPALLMARAVWISREDMPEADADAVDEWLKAHDFGTFCALMLTALPAIALASLVMALMALY